jgi:DNA (cytosine-5)-methyltransferase 1
VAVVHGTQDPCVSDKAYALGRNGGQENAVAFQQNASGEVRTGEQAYTLNTNSNASGRNTGMVALMGNQRAEIRLSDQTDALTTGGGKPGQGYAATFDRLSATVRRLTPRECERLQGFPDDHTLIPWRRKPVEDCPDGPRYKAIGNSKAVPVIRWVGLRIKKHLEEI